MIGYKESGWCMTAGARDLSDSGSKKASSCYSFSSYIPLLHFVLVTTLSAETWNANSSTCDCSTVDCSAIKHFSLRKNQASVPEPEHPDPLRLSSNCRPSIPQSHSPAQDAPSSESDSGSVAALVSAISRSPNSSVVVALYLARIHFPLSPDAPEIGRLRDNINKERAN
jgi:hypothetical protein